jgi:hypothetical protein
VCACGRNHEVSISKLSCGSTKSCRCSRTADSYVYGTGNPLIATVLTTYKHRAKKKNLDFRLDHYAVKKLVTAPCYYCGVIPYRQWNVVTASGKIDSLACNGIDRVNNDLGYVPSNVVPCCPRCNYAKREMGLQEFAAWAIRLSEHLQRHVVSVASASPTGSKTTVNSEHSQGLSELTERSN